MSFVSILKHVGSTLIGIEHIAAPVAEGLFPMYAPEIKLLDDVFSKIQVGIIANEVANPTNGQGSVKAAISQTNFDVSLSLIQDVLKTQGKLLTYDGDALNSVINSQVTAYNAMAALKASFKIVDQPK